MANFGTVMASDLTKYDRMDAGFHLLRQKMENQAARIEAIMDRSEVLELALDMLAKVPAEFRRKIDPLVRGSTNRAPDIEAQKRAVTEYPYIALAIFEDNAGAIAQHYQEKHRRPKTLPVCFASLLRSETRNDLQE